LQPKAKWCHFALNTEDAPDELHRLSAALKLPKERAALSFILAGKAAAQNPVKRATRSERTERVKARVISDSFPISADSPGTRERENNPWGRYACSERGLVLATGSRRTLESAQPGALEELALEDGRIDTKSGAYIGNIL